ncbi:MAG: signal peptidase II [Thermodesulfovibrionales bacterium]
MIYLLLSLFIILADQVTKHLVRTMIMPHEAIEVLPFLQIVHIRNVGAAFGLFRGFGNITFIIISIAAIIAVFYLLVRDKKDRISYSLILGGAIGNLIDRIIYGDVTDFIDLYAGRFHWPAFNVADSALTIGISLMFLIHLREILKGKVSIHG